MPTDVVEGTSAPVRRGPIRAPQSLVSGLTLIAIAAFAIWATGNLSQGTLRAMGPAMLPRWLAIGLGLCGIGLIVSSFLVDGSPLERWYFRGPLFVAVGVAVFALLIRPATYAVAGMNITMPIAGLAVAGPLAMFIGGFGTPDVRFKEILIFAIVMTLFCVGLFRYALNLPIPIIVIPGIIQI
jgi:hypothetical protein